MLLGNAIGIPFYWRFGGLQLPLCSRDLAVSWHRNLNSRIDEGDTYPYVKDSIGIRTDTVYYGQYLDATSGQINFLRTSGTFDYIDPSDGSFVEGISIPGTGLYTIPANGICDIGVGPIQDSVVGLLDFDGNDDYVLLNTVPDITGDKLIEFNLYLKSISTPGSTQTLINFSSDTLDHLSVFMASGQDYLYISCTTAVVTTNFRVGLSSLTANEILNIKVNKSTGVINSVLINDVSYPINNATASTIVGSRIIGAVNIASEYFDNGYLWDINIYDDPSGTNTLTNNFPGQPAGDTDAAWDDTVGSLTATVNGSPSLATIYFGDITYDSFYPICEKAGIVLHDVNENSIHISVDSPSWSESLYGSDYLNQQGFVIKAESDTLGYDWETLVNITPITLNDNTLVPLGQWDYQPLLDSLGDPILDSEDDPIYTKENL